MTWPWRRRTASTTGPKAAAPITTIPCTPWAGEPARGGFAVFGVRDFTLFLVARFVAQVAVQMMVIALGWQVYHLTGRVLDLGLIGLSQFLPFLCLALFAGHAADVHERRVIIMLCL